MPTTAVDGLVRAGKHMSGAGATAEEYQLTNACAERNQRQLRRRLMA